MKHCKLLGGTLAYTIQFLLGISAVGSLVYKRHVERPQRPWKIWSFDVGKQLVGGFFVHFANIGVSSVLETSGGDQCAWYFLNFLVDCTFGVAIVYAVHESVVQSAVHVFSSNSALARIGFYGDPPNLKIWFKQMGVYLFSLIVNKALVFSLFYVSLSTYEAFGNWLFGPLQSRPQAELIVVMVLCPWFLTTIQFLIFDAILKAEPPQQETDEHAIETYSAFGAEKSTLITTGTHV
mmetsp:Transcript_47218/g.95150  ORF Transcript_47218/g.95150 Transcript_47218/m.95150 type:complete len:236 (+) Transcript_47218:105-812(+)